MKSIYSIALLAVLSLILSCNAKNDSSPILTNKTVGVGDLKEIASSDKVEQFANTFNADTAAQWQQPADPQKKHQPVQSILKPDWDKKIIKTATLNTEVKDYNVYYSLMREKVKNLGGYIAQEEQNQSDYKIENSLVIKVPVDQFDNAVAQLTDNTQKINEKKISSQDVTTEIVDTKSRMESKKQVRLRYLDLLKQAKNMEEILNVQSEINSIQEDIESAAGRIEYLGHSSSYSTINLTYYQILNVAAKDTDKPSFGTKLSSAFRIGWDWIGELFVGMVSIWPLLLLVFAIVIIYKRTRVQMKIENRNAKIESK